MVGVVETKMSVVAEKLRQIEIEISEDNGDFNLFALIEREDSLGKWDVVVAANWAENDRKKLVNDIALKIRENLSKDEQLMLSRIVTLSPSETLVQNLNLIIVEHGMAKLSNNNFNGIIIKEAYLITSKSK